MCGSRAIGSEATGPFRHTVYTTASGLHSSTFPVDASTDRPANKPSHRYSTIARFSDGVDSKVREFDAKLQELKDQGLVGPDMDSSLMRRLPAARRFAAEATAKERQPFATGNRTVPRRTHTVLLAPGRIKQNTYVTVMPMGGAEETVSLAVGAGAVGTGSLENVRVDHWQPQALGQLRALSNGSSGIFDEDGAESQYSDSCTTAMLQAAKNLGDNDASRSQPYNQSHPNPAHASQSGASSLKRAGSASSSFNFGDLPAHASQSEASSLKRAGSASSFNFGNLPAVFTIRQSQHDAAPMRSFNSDTQLTSAEHLLPRLPAAFTVCQPTNEDTGPLGMNALS